MAYSYAVLYPANTMSVSLTQGDVLRYAGVLLNVVTPMNGFNVTTSFVTYAIEQGWMSYVEAGASIPANTPNSDLEIQSGSPDENENPPPPPPPPSDGETGGTGGTATATLTAKTIAGFTKAAQLIGENRTHIKTAESDITSLKTRVTAAEGSIATVDQRIADAETRAKNSAVEQIMGGVTNAQLDTIKELGDALTNLSGDGVAAINAALAKRVSVDAQTWTSNEQAQARINIGAASGSDVTNAISAAVGDPSTIDIDAIFASVGTF